MEKSSIIIIGGALKKDIDGNWHTTRFSEGDNFGSLGDILRVIAGSILYKKMLNRLIVTGGLGQLKNIPDVPHISQVIKQELIELGVNSNDIIIETESNNTYEQLLSAGNIANREGLEKLIIISNKYHLPRIKAMIKYFIKLKNVFSGKKLIFKSAEKILLKYDSKNWKKEINDAYKSILMKNRVVLERQGVRDIKQGKYIL